MFLAWNWLVNDLTEGLLFKRLFELFVIMLVLVLNDLLVFFCSFVF